MRQAPTLNVLGTPLVPCSHDPLTGWYRDGCCNTDAQDHGSHVVCAQMTLAFLNDQFERGQRPDHAAAGAPLPGTEAG